jgi:hypothetical protein
VCRFIDDPNSAAVAILVRPSPNDKRALTIEVLNEVNGLTEADLGLQTEIELSGGHRYRVPSPLVMLKAKLYNLVSLANLDRPQDIRHVRMLLHIVPFYFNELADEYMKGRVSEDNLLGAVRYAGDVVLASFAGNAGRSHRLQLDEIFPSSIRLSGPQSVRVASEAICHVVRGTLGK